MQQIHFLNCLHLHINCHFRTKLSSLCLFIYLHTTKAEITVSSLRKEHEEECKV
jgi:hypothetical protein